MTSPSVPSVSSVDIPDPSLPSASSVDKPNNALKHGLTARQIVLPSESEADWHVFRQAYLDDLAPQGIVETELAVRAAELAWRLRRVASAEREAVLDYEQRPDRYTNPRQRPSAFDAYHAPSEPPDTLPEHLPAPAALRPITRYEAHLSRQYFLVTTRLQQLQDRRNGRNANVHIVEVHGFKNVGAPPAAPSPAELQVNVGAQPAAPSPANNELPNEPHQSETQTRTSGAFSPARCRDCHHRHAPAPPHDVAQPSPAVHPPAEGEVPNEPPDPEPHPSTGGASAPPDAATATNLYATARGDAGPPPAAPSPATEELPNEPPPALTRIPPIPGLTPEIIEAVRKRVLHAAEEDDDEQFEGYDPLYDEEEEELARQFADELHDDVPLRFREFQRELRRQTDTLA